MATQTKPISEYSTDEVVERGEEIYQSGIRQTLETGDNIGKLLMIDIETGEWVIGTDRIEMARRARAKNPHARLYGLKIGYPAASAIGTTLRPLSEMAVRQKATEDRTH